MWRPCFWLTDHTLLLWGACPPLRTTWDHFTVLNFQEIPILSLLSYWSSFYLGFPLPASLGFSTVGLACTHSETQMPRLWEAIAPPSFSLLLSLRPSLLSAKPALCVPLSGSAACCCCFSYLVHPVVVISMEEGASSPACSPPPHTHTLIPLG